MDKQPRTVDQELVDAAAHVARTRAHGDNHTMAAAARTRDGRIVTGVNVYHFTGGPCAELVAIGAAATQGAYELDTMVAVGDRDRGVVPPCGRCRQVLLDYFPDITVIVGAPGGGLRAVGVRELLPESYVWSDHQIDSDSHSDSHSDGNSDGNGGAESDRDSNGAVADTGVGNG